MRRLCPKPPQLPHRFIGLTAGVGAIVVKILDGQEEERASFIAADIPLKRKTQELYNELVVLSSVCALKCLCSQVFVLSSVLFVLSSVLFVLPKILMNIKFSYDHIPFRMI